MHKIDYERHILSLKDDELEKLVRLWAEAQKNLYYSTQRKAGSGDQGRDVVGFFSDEKHEGKWDNYQCKQYGKTLPTAEGMLEIGKILFYSFQGQFTPPENYYFVAPRGVNKNLDFYISNPSIFKKNLIEEWDKYCKDKIIQNSQVILTRELNEFIQKYDFKKINVIDVDTIANDVKFRGILVDYFGGELLPAPDGEVPSEIQANENKYIGKILDSYSDHDQVTYASIEDIKQHDIFFYDFNIQRERFYSADAFKCFYRDNTVGEILDSFENEVFKGVISTSLKKYDNAFECLCSVMDQAANIQISGKLSIHARVDVKQGYCHHFANSDKISWKRNK
ncbi:ABC-three component system protein [Plesiomonas shigelloides]|uniref:ABC-three component system protein n=1 Tax=Plesiomonas shigelloides TaxID=703 RepID=UPI00387F2BCD